MNVENGTPWKSAAMAVALLILEMRTGNGANCRRKSNDAVATCTCLIVSVASCFCLCLRFTRQLPSCVLYNTLRSAHLNRQRVSISSISRSSESCVKKYWSWLSDSDCQSVGSDKLKNAFILRKYGSIWVGEKTSCLFWFLHKHDFVKNITCRNGYTNITSILCFVWRKCNSERISFHL